MKKKAMAIEIVLIFAAIMGGVGLFLLRTTQTNNKQLETSMDQLQSYFIARAGAEHAMLKIKLLNREFYDSICMYQGRSPLFNYNGLDVNNPCKNICATNPGPIFLFKAEESGSLKTNGVFTDMSSGPYSDKYDKWIKVFKEDIRSNFTDANACLSMDPLTPNKINEIMGSVEHSTGESNENFIGFKKAIYELSNIDFGASGVTETKISSDNNTINVDNTIVVNFTIKSSYISVKNQSYDYEITRTVTVSRESKL